MNHDHHHAESTSTFEVKLKNKKRVAEGTMAFFFEKPEGFEFTAGQHTTVTLVNPPETDAEGNSRHFSLVGSPKDAEIEIATRIRDTAFKRVLSKLETGSKVLMEKPHGSYILHSDSSKPAVFLIGGIGITPVMSIIKDAGERKLPHRIYLFYSNKRPEDAPFLKELWEMEKQNPSFKLIATMDEMENSEQTWNGETRVIDAAMLKKYLIDFESAIYYLSGPPAMNVAMRKLLTDIDVSEESIQTEEFTGY